MLKLNQTKAAISLGNFDKFLALAWPKFIESKNGFVFVIEEWREQKEIKDQAKNRYMEFSRFRFFDNTDYESSLNHVHVEDILQLKQKKRLEKICYKIGEMWVAKLRNEFPEKHFRVYLIGTILRFHQIHEGEAPWLDEKDFQKDIKKGKIVIWEI